MIFQSRQINQLKYKSSNVTKSIPKILSKFSIKSCSTSIEASNTIKSNKSNTSTNPLKNQQSITPQSQDFSKWYLELISRAELADYGPVRGTMVIRPYAYAIWEQIKEYLDIKFKETNHQNAYFPQLIPFSFIQKESDHIEGFAPELAIVTKAGDKDLEEPLVVRPTSETIVNYMFSQWIQSYRDLPLLLNQWVNVHRWEMRTRPFIRTTEFLWQEGHTAHATEKEAEEEVMRMIKIYESFSKDIAAIPVIIGKKSKIESFAGANATYTIEAMMKDKKALQAGTSHNLGTNFAKAFNIMFQDKNQEMSYVYQTSWGISTRFIGGIIMTHGDDKGLRLPPYLAPIQVIIIPIYKKTSDNSAINKIVNEMASNLKQNNIRCKVDLDESSSPGFKFNEYEMKGIPIRIEVGERDIKQDTCVIARRDLAFGKQNKIKDISISKKEYITVIIDLFNEIQNNLLKEATDFRDQNIIDVKNYTELKNVINEGKWARGYWAGTDDDEKKIKEECQATLRCFPLEDIDKTGPCFMTNQQNGVLAIFAKAY